jgi:integrase
MDCFTDAPGVLRRRRNANRHVRLPDRLLAHVRRWQRLGIAKNAVIEWNGKPVRSVKKGFAAAVRTAGIPGLIPHSLRHTAATWLMRQGVPISEAADFLGMTEQVLRQHYYHHHPDFQRLAADSLGSRLPGQFRDRNTGNKARQIPSRMTKNRLTFKG